MLTRLIIHDFVIIDSIDINFNNGLNIIIGETGSGKSIMFDA
ncbi:MAG: AAA family ATPase, partial [Bacteroidetes bacterium]|nr:AAA family ATPase [Bacteroidota bacterium]